VMIPADTKASALQNGCNNAGVGIQREYSATSKLTAAASSSPRTMLGSSVVYRWRWLPNELA